VKVKDKLEEIVVWLGVTDFTSSLERFVELVFKKSGSEMLNSFLGAFPKFISANVLTGVRMHVGILFIFHVCFKLLPEIPILFISGALFVVILIFATTSPTGRMFSIEIFVLHMLFERYHIVRLEVVLLLIIFSMVIVLSALIIIILKLVHRKSVRFFLYGSIVGFIGCFIYPAYHFFQGCVFSGFVESIILDVSFLIAVVLDAIDGPLARYRNVISLFGARFDPAADKFLNLPMIYRLSAIKFLAEVLWMIGFDALTFVLGTASYFGISKQKANSWGKLKMIFQFIVLLFLTGYDLIRWLPDGYILWVTEGVLKLGLAFFTVVVVVLILASCEKIRVGLDVLLGKRKKSFFVLFFVVFSIVSFQLSMSPENVEYFSLGIVKGLMWTAILFGAGSILGYLRGFVIEK